MRKRLFVLPVVFALAAVFFASGCREKAQPAQAPAPVVNTVTVLQQDLPWNIEYPAQVAGSLEIQIRAQVGGILEARLYNEGEYVTEGTQLFQIDDKEYKVALEKAKGALAQAVAEEKRTQRTYTRMKKLRADNAVSQQDYDNALSAYESAQANVQVTKAGVSDAEINLGYTKVTAPISGIASKEAQSVGSLISPAGETGLLTTMVRINPLYVNFSMPSRQFEKLASGFLSGQIAIGKQEQQGYLSAEEYRNVSAQNAPIYVEAVLANGKLYPERGKIIFFDSSENSQTSSLAMKAEFPNPKNSRALMPGQFVRVRLVGAVYKNAVLVPSSAVLNTQNGLMAYVVDAKNTVAARTIQGQLQDDMYIVTDGLKAGENVISGGLARIRPGQQVQPQPKEFKVRQNEPQEEKAPEDDGRGAALLDQVIAESEAPDAQAVPNEAQQEAVPAADAQPVSAPGAASSRPETNAFTQAAANTQPSRQDGGEKSGAKQ